MAHDGGGGVGGGCALLLDIQTALGVRPGPGCRLIHDVESGPCRAGCANETASGPRSLAGRGWGRWPNREAGFGSQRVSLGRHPTLRSGLIKGGARSRSTSSLLVSAPRCLCPSLALHSRLVCDGDVLIPEDQGRAHVTTSLGKVTKPEITRQLSRWECSSRASHGGTRYTHRPLHDSVRVRRFDVGE